MLSVVPENRPNLKRHSTKRDLKTKLRISAVNWRYYLETTTRTYFIARNSFQMQMFIVTTIKKFHFSACPPSLEQYPKHRNWHRYIVSDNKVFKKCFQCIAAGHEPCWEFKEECDLKALLTPKSKRRSENRLSWFFIIINEFVYSTRWGQVLGAWK